jgi:signal transduction histidine kinase
MRQLRPGSESRRRVLLLLLCTLFIAGAAACFLLSVARPDTGLVGYYPEAKTADGAVVFSPASPFSPAAESGLLAGRDRILSVNGVPVSGSRDLVRACTTVRGFAPFPVVVSRDGGPPLIVPVRPAFLPARPDWLFVLVFCAALVLTSLLTAARLPGEPWTLPLVLCALLSLLLTATKSLAWDGPVMNLLFNAGNVGAWLLVVFALYFPRPRASRGARGALAAGVVALYAAFCVARLVLFLRWQASGVERLLDLYRLVGQAGNVSDGVAYAVFVVLLSTAGRHARLPVEKSMLQWITAGVLVALPPYFLFDQLPLLLGGVPGQVGLGSIAQLFLTLLPVSLLVGLARKRPFDFRSFLVRYALYGFLFVLMIVLFLVLYLPMKSFIETGWGVAAPLPELFSSAIIVLTLGLLAGLLEWVARRLARGHADGGPPAAATHAEVRALVQGMARAIRPTLRHRATDAAAGSAEEREEAARACGLLEALAEGTARHPAIHGSFPARVLAEGAVEAARRRFPRAAFVLRGGSAERISCSYTEIVSALSAVVENAAEAAEGTGEPVVIRLGTDAESTFVEVSDQGPGFDPRALRHLFEPFSTTRPGHDGLGLFLARLGVETNGGRICARAGETGGATVRLEFPRGGYEKERG